MFFKTWLAHKQKLLLIIVLKGSMHLLRLFTRTLNLVVLTQLILSLILITLYISIKSILIYLYFKVVKQNLFNRSSYLIITAILSVNCILFGENIYFKSIFNLICLYELNYLFKSYLKLS